MDTETRTSLLKKRRDETILQESEETEDVEDVEEDKYDKYERTENLDVIVLESLSELPEAFSQGDDLTGEEFIDAVFCIFGSSAASFIKGLIWPPKDKHE